MKRQKGSIVARTAKAGQYIVLQAKKRLSGRGDSQTPPYLGGQEKDKPAMKESFGEMDAIAVGVEARLDLLLGYSKVVTQRTIEVAQQLGIPEKEIGRWADMRARLDSERSRRIESSLNKLERSPLAQSMMGIAVPYLCPPKPGES